MRLVKSFIFYTVIFTLVACGGGGNNTTAERGGLISAKLLDTKPSNFLVPYSVKAYKITYGTIDVDGKSMSASGLLAVPSKGAGVKSPLLSYQHGTIFLNGQAPSLSVLSATGIMTLAGKGYIVSAPDYIGYGESSHKNHPYMHASSLASASVDMLKASNEFLKKNNIKTNSQLFLAGYSEGGYATLALQKSIQENHASEFTVTASAAGAGPFDLVETAKTLSNKVTNQKPAYMSFLLKSYDDVYGLNKVSEMFQSQYVNAINSVFNGANSSGVINSQLTSTTSALFKAPFLNVLQGTGSHAITDKLALNALYDWKPSAPTRFYHSQNDEIVPYHNAQKAKNSMLAKGASVSLGNCHLNTHVGCALLYVSDALSFFGGHAQDL